MKTAEDLLKEMGISPVFVGKRNMDLCELLIKSYGKQCAEQALKDAADNTYALNDPSSYQIEQSILSTPIVTP